ncbi:MAG: hypothetical protein K8S54_15965 [Spirochaetia bacterium]|nr:hypothetical protein [Spirochaetia bacterium]
MRLARIAVLLLLGSLACHVDRKLEVPEQTRVVKCETNAYMLKGLCDDEVEYLNWAAKYPGMPKLADVNQEGLHKIVQDTKDVDRAAAVYYHRVISESRNRELVEFLDRKQTVIATKKPDFSSKKLLLALAPGMFYADNPQTGADGQELRTMAKELGLAEAVIPVEQTGTIETNATIICNFVKSRDDVQGIIIASLSKGSGDFKRAIQKCGDEPYFKKVRAWYNIVGINKGSHLITDIDQTWQYKMEARAYFCWNGYNWDGFMSMRAGAGAPLESELKIPQQMLVVNVVAVPLFRFVTDRARPFYEYLIRYGPNDGMTLLADSAIAEGVTYVSWRNDHYFRFPIYRPRMQAFLVYIVEKKFADL